MSIRVGITVMLCVWVAILVKESFMLYDLLHRPHNTDEVLFPITIIIITLVVGCTALSLASRIGKGESI